jgi:hypothetical protein
MLVEYAEGLEHCIHPDFLDDQIGRSLDRLGLDALDGYLLHNPEYYLGWAHKQGLDHDRRPAGILPTDRPMPSGTWSEKFCGDGYGFTASAPTPSPLLPMILNSPTCTVYGRLPNPSAVDHHFQHRSSCRSTCLSRGPP